jgi:hypothetical protein
MKMMKTRANGILAWMLYRLPFFFILIPGYLLLYSTSDSMLASLSFFVFLLFFFFTLIFWSNEVVGHAIFRWLVHETRTSTSTGQESENVISKENLKKRALRFERPFFPSFLSIKKASQT